MGTDNNVDSKWDRLSRWLDRKFWWIVAGGVLLIALLGCTPPSPVVTPTSGSPKVYLIVASPKDGAGATFAASWGPGVVKVDWRAQAVFPEAVDPSGKHAAGVLRFRGGYDTLAVVTLTKPVAGIAPWRIGITGASYGKAAGYQPMAVSLVTVVMGVVK